jgi:hypothetical protein
MNHLTRPTRQLDRHQPGRQSITVDGEFRIHRRIDERVPLSYLIVAFSLAIIVFGILLCIYCIFVAGLRFI